MQNYFLKYKTLCHFRVICNYKAIILENSTYSYWRMHLEMARSSNVMAVLLTSYRQEITYTLS